MGCRKWDAFSKRRGKTLGKTASFQKDRCEWRIVTWKRCQGESYRQRPSSTASRSFSHSGTLCHSLFSLTLFLSLSLFPLAQANLASDEIVRQLLAVGENNSEECEGETETVQEANDKEAGMAKAANTTLAERLGLLSQRLDKARCSLLSTPTAGKTEDVKAQSSTCMNDVAGKEEEVLEHVSAVDDEEESRRDSLEEALALEFSPPKTTLLLPATPKSKSRPSLGAQLRFSMEFSANLSNTKPVPSSDATVDEDPRSPELGLGMATAVVKPILLSAPQTSSNANGTTGHTENPEPHAQQTVEAAASSGKGILQSNEYWKLRLERSERKRRRIDQVQSISMYSIPDAAESTHSFCKRITGMCEEVNRLSMTPHKLLGVHPQSAYGSSFKLRPPPLATLDSSPRAAEAQNSCPGTPLNPTTPSGLSKSAKVSLWRARVRSLWGAQRRGF